MKVHAVLLGLCLGLPGCAHGGVLAEERTAPFMLSVLRQDGLAVPFASFDGRRWATRWPERVPPEVPISIDDVPDRWWGIEPFPRRMHLWRNGTRAGEVTVTGPSMARLMCEPRLALRTDHKPAAPAPPQFVLPYPKDGLLVAGEVPIGRIDSVPSGSAEWNKVLAAATGEFNKQETTAAGAFTSWRHPVKASQRKLVPIKLEALYRGPSDSAGWTAYFMEAVREFPPGPADKDGCGLATYASGWVMVGPTDRTRLHLGAKVTYCDRKNVGYMLPLGVIHANGRTFWVFQYAGFEFEAYEVVRPTPRGGDSEVVYTAGICAR